MQINRIDNDTLLNIKQGLTVLGDSVSYILTNLGEEDSSAKIKVSANGVITIGEQITQDGKLRVYGKLGVNVNNIPGDVDIMTQNPIRFQGKKMENGTDIPVTGTYAKGDIVWNTEPQIDTPVGWVCIRTGTPGEWKPFGKIY